MHSVAMPRRERKTARPSWRDGGPEKRKRAFCEFCAGEASERKARAALAHRLVSRTERQCCWVG
eukprot:6190495-Pleurochrysis_carterae.AAC.3